MIILPVVGRLADDDLAPTDVFITATKAIVRGTAHFDNSSFFQYPVGYLAARVLVPMAVWPHSRVYRGHLTFTIRASRHCPDHYHSSTHLSFSHSTSISIAPRLLDIRNSHRPTMYLPGVRDPRVIKLQVSGPIPVAQVKVVARAKERTWDRCTQFIQIMTPQQVL